MYSLGESQSNSRTRERASTSAAVTLRCTDPSPRGYRDAADHCIPDTLTFEEFSKHPENGGEVHSPRIPRHPPYNWPHSCTSEVTEMAFRILVIDDETAIRE